MGKVTSLRVRDLIGAIKDKASLSKAAIASLSTPQISISIRFAVLRATTHFPSAPPDDHQLSTLLSLGDGSRATASCLVSTLMDRLHRTRTSTVVLKCLVIIHYILKHGSFILQDQLSIFPATGGHNYLKLSGFREDTSAFTWVLSGWVRWYARYTEALLSTSRVLGYLFISKICSMVEKGGGTYREERVSSILDQVLIREVDSLVGLTEELCKVPDPDHLFLQAAVHGNKLLHQVFGLLNTDYLSTVNEILSRLGEVSHRLSGLSFGDSVELICALKRLEDCKERLSVLFTVVDQHQHHQIDTLWGMICELKEKLANFNLHKDHQRKLLTGEGELMQRASESARFGDRVLKATNSVSFSSQRLSFQQ